ncbi:MAG: divalent-cation tolerance protein CutA [Rickettsiales bacterium]|nr:divalent-cation tolerance protein CutA [Rickettsiales bacterium]
MKKNFITINTTYPNSKIGKKLLQNLSQFLLEKKLAACIQSQKISSNYLWQEKIYYCEEILVNIKTEAKLYKKIEEIILKNHCFEVPQITVEKINGGLTKYLSWIAKNTSTK